MSWTTIILLIPAACLSLFAFFCGLGLMAVWTEMVVRKGFRESRGGAVMLTLATFGLMSLLPALCFAVYASAR